jgi:tellurite methyltransferase
LNRLNLLNALNIAGVTMSSDDQSRWDHQYALSPAAELPSVFLWQILDSAAWDIPRGVALDVAAGTGRNAIFLAERGFRVVAIDISSIALDEARRRAEKKSLTISWHQADLEQIELPHNTYDLIVNFNYLQRSSFPQIRKSLKADGRVIFETYLVDQQAIGHPKNPAYLLNHNELLEQFRDFRVLCYREGKYTDAKQPAFRAGIFAQKLADNPNADI